MTTMYTKDKKQLKSLIVDFLKANKINYSITSDERIIIPYRSLVESEELQVNIAIIFVEGFDAISFNAIFILRKETNLDEVRTNLLSMNSHILYGSLSLEEGSDKIWYKSNYFLEDNDTIELSRYTRIVVECLELHKKLYEAGYIKSASGL